MKEVNNLVFPAFMTKGGGEKFFYKVKDQELLVTSIYEKDGTVWARGYKLPSERKSKHRNWEIFNEPLHMIE